MNEPAHLGESLLDSAQRLGLPKTKPFDLGVLLVHGIGEQQRGDTLTEAGDRLLDWLRRTFDAAEAAEIAAGTRKVPRELTIADVVLRQASADEVPAAHAVVRIGRPNDDRGAVHWVIAEAWWADVFRMATYGELASWGVAVGHWVFATQIQSIRQRMEIGAGVPLALRLALLPVVWLIGGAMVLLAAVLSLFLSLLALSLLLLALLRLPIVSDFARSMQRTLMSGVGDAYVLTRSPIRFGAMATQVRSDLQTLRHHASQVAVVAHSQGTAVAWAALKRELLEPTDKEPDGEAPQPSTDAPVGLLLTYGQALRKLTFLLMIARREVSTGQGPAAAAAVSVLLLAAIAQMVLRVGSPLTIAASLLLAMAAEFGVLATARRISGKVTEKLEDQWRRMHEREPTLRWLDLWASADPVPGGPLDVNDIDISSFKIRNLASPALDHVVYWQNNSEFLETLASKMHALGGPETRRAHTFGRQRWQLAGMRRNARVLLLMTLRIIIVGAIVSALAAAWLTPTFSSGVIDLLRVLPFIDSLLKDPADWLRSLAGVIVVAAGGGLVWSGVAIAWNALIAVDDERYVQDARYDLWEPLAWPVLAGTVIGLGYATIIVLNWLHHPLIATIYGFAAPLAALMGLTIISSGGRTLADAEEEAQGVMASTPVVAGSNVVGGVVVMLTATVLLALPTLAYLLRPELLGWALRADAIFIGVVLGIEALREYRHFHRAFEKRLEKLR